MVTLMTRGNFFKKNQEMNKDDGLHKHERLPVVLGPMLTNEVMDMISRNRLLWQINRFYK